MSFFIIKKLVCAVRHPNGEKVASEELCGQALYTHRCPPPTIFMTVASKYQSEPWILTPFPPHVTMVNPLAKFQLCQSTSNECSSWREYKYGLLYFRASSISPSLRSSDDLLNLVPESQERCRLDFRKHRDCAEHDHRQHNVMLSTASHCFDSVVYL